MKRLFVLGTVCAALVGCGVKGDLVREPGTEPPSVATSSIQDATTEPSKPSTWLF